jgi:hypothetical protein
MAKYKTVDISEKQLEDIIRKNTDLIENGLKFIDHQKRTERGPLDVLAVDSGSAFVVAELKIKEDDNMLVQGLDYYDYLTSNVEGYANAYKDKGVDPRQEPRLFLIAPSFSMPLINRCKWIDVRVSLFTFQCIELDDKPGDIIPIFKEIAIPSRSQPVAVYTMEQRLKYITEVSVRKQVDAFLDELKSWEKEKITIEPLKYDISIKISGSVLAYLSPRRKHFVVYTYDKDDDWKPFAITSKEELETLKVLLKTNLEEFKQTPW